MKKNLVMTMLFTPPILAMSSSSWLMIWILLELTSMSFIMSLMVWETQKENMLKYFLIQAMASTVMLVLFSNKSIKTEYKKLIQMNMLVMIIILVMAMKMAMSPFHMWFPKMINSLKWNNSMILMSYQKIIPIKMMMLNSSFILMAISMMSLIVGSLSQFNISSIKMILAFSSISHMGWMMITNSSSNIPMMYLVIYSLILLMNIKVMNENNIKMLNSNNQKMNKLILALNLLSMAGMPPLMGFIPKWMILKEMTQINKSILTIIIMLLMSAINFFIYIRVMNETLMYKKDNKKKHQEKKNPMSILMNLIIPTSIIQMKK